MPATAQLESLRMILDVSMRAATIGAAIARARKEKGLKQRHLAAQIPGRDGPIGTQTVSNWERGVHAPEIETLEVVAQVLGKPLSYFLGEEEASPRSEDVLSGLLAVGQELIAGLSELRGLLALQQETVELLRSLVVELTRHEAAK